MAYTEGANNLLYENAKLILTCHFAHIIIIIWRWSGVESSLQQATESDRILSGAAAVVILTKWASLSSNVNVNMRFPQKEFTSWCAALPLFRNHDKRFGDTERRSCQSAAFNQETGRQSRRKWPADIIGDEIFSPALSAAIAGGIKSPECQRCFIFNLLLLWFTGVEKLRWHDSAALTLNSSHHVCLRRKGTEATENLHELVQINAINRGGNKITNQLVAVNWPEDISIQRQGDKAEHWWWSEEENGGVERMNWPMACRNR